MVNAQRPWYKRPLPLIGGLLGCLLVAIILMVVWQTVHFIILKKSGQATSPDDDKLQTMRANAAKMFSSTHPSPELIRTIEGGSNPALGNPAAPLRIVEFVDYDCPYCLSIDPAVREFMQTHATDTYFILRDFPVTDLHPHAQEAALAARCAWLLKPERFWDFHQALFARQGDRSQEEFLYDARQLGIDEQSFKACLAGNEAATQVQNSLHDGTDAGVKGTPTFFFNGVMVPGALDQSYLELFSQEARRVIKP